MEEATKIILNYLLFLKQSFNNINDVSKYLQDDDLFDELRNDFLQANWEIFVESVICIPGKEFLDVYGAGADCNGASSRVCFPDKLPTHKIQCKPKDKSSEFLVDRLTGNEINIANYEFYSFISFDEGEINEYHPYNGVLLESDRSNDQVVVAIDEVTFFKVAKSGQPPPPTDPEEKKDN